MKNIVSVSLGSSSRDHKVEMEMLGEKVTIQRIGTDGNLEKAIAFLKEMDGTVDAFGIGGIDLCVQVGKRRYMLRDGRRMADAVKHSPIVDGSGLKNTLERKVISQLNESGVVSFNGLKVFMVCAADRFGMAEEMRACGAELIIGDLMFALKIPVAIKSLNALDKVGRIAGPLVSRLPARYIYPTGGKEERPNAGFSKYYHEADVVAGDFHFIKKHLPDEIPGKIIITNTTTKEDVEMLRERGAAKLITTTPELNGRSFGTNVMEALLAAFLGKPVEEITAEDYSSLLDRLNFEPRIIDFTESENKEKEKEKVQGG